MKRIILVILILSINLAFSQSYFEGKNLYCKSENPESMKLFNLGIETLYLNKSLDKKYLNITSKVFLDAYKKDTTFCDALFFTGYTLRLLNNKNALLCYMLADSLYNKSIEFKTNLAAECLRYANEKTIPIARKKYTEIIQLFPENPEGYYGFAVTSPFLGDYEKGLENINTAIQKYIAINPKLKNDVLFLKGILLSLNKRYEDALPFLENISSTYKKDFNFRVHYSLCLLKVSEIRKDEKIKEKAQKIYEKIEDKNQIPDDIKQEFVF
ncbi:tetratricopeptide repeat protein [Flavobacterium sp. 22076]|uniref:tetratricopeptide repeat protein n=1 Tax=unclassified Flavobacterium TaxID=196869 RepID=UPI003F86796B